MTQEGFDQLGFGVDTVPMHVAKGLIIIWNLAGLSVMKTVSSCVWSKMIEGTLENGEKGQTDHRNVIWYKDFEKSYFECFTI